MKKIQEKFANRLKLFAFIMLSFIAVGTVVGCTGMDADTFLTSLYSAGSIVTGVGMATVPWMTIIGDAKVATFKELDAKEIEKLEPEQKSAYVADLIKWQTSQIKSLNERVGNEDENAKELKKQIKELTSANMAAMKSSLEAQGTQIAKLMKDIEGQTKNSPLTLRMAILKSLDDNKEQVANALKEKRSITLEIPDFVMKASQGAGDIDSGTDFAFLEPGVGQIATRRTFMRALFPNRNVNTEYVKYNDQETIVRDAKNVAACAATTHTSKITWKVRTMQITKVRDFVDVCIDMFEDYDFVEGEIRGLVDTDVRLKVDEGLLLGDGIYPNINGVASVASTFAAGSYALSVQAPTLVDLVMVTACQIADFGQNNKFIANVALLNPVDACLLKLEKDVDNNYLIPNFITSNGVNIGAVRIIENPLVPANQMYIMDSTMAVIYNRKGISVDLAFENKDNFEKELVTVKAYERLNMRVRNVDANAFMHVPSISAAIIAITKP